MLYDRSYMRDASPGPNRPMIFWIIGSLIAVFVLQQVVDVWFQSSFIWRHLALSPPTIKSGQVWTLLSYAFLHGGVMHLVVNCLMLFFLGRALEADIGGRRLLHVAIWGALGGAVLWLIVNHVRTAPLVGASAAAMALLTVFVCLHPRRPITLMVFFVLPVTLLPIWLLAIVGGLDVLGFLFRELPGGAQSDSVAHSAHLGGLAAGYLYYRLVIARTGSGPAWKSNTEVEAPRWFSKAKSTGLTEARYKVDVNTTDGMKAEVDRILDKINSEGFGALTPEEKAHLDSARHLLSKR